jgi:hypothetical protein
MDCCGHEGHDGGDAWFDRPWRLGLLGNIERTFPMVS